MPRKARKRKPAGGKRPPKRARPAGPVSPELRALVRSLPDVAYFKDSRNRLAAVNKPFARLVGRKVSEIIGKSDAKLLPPAVLKACRAAEAKARRTRRPQRLELSFCVGGEACIFDTMKTAFFGKRGRFLGFLGTCRDITGYKRADEELRKTTRALKVLSLGNRAAARAAAEKQLLDDICRIAVDVGGYRMAWIGLAQDDARKSVKPVARAGIESGYLAKAGITWADTARGRGPTGTAARTGKPSVARNIVEEPRFAPWRKEALRRGYASSVALPLLRGRRAFGTLNIYASEPDAFGKEEVRLLRDLTEGLSFGIRALREKAASERAGRALVESEMKYRGVVEQAGEAFFLHDLEGRVIDVNRQACRSLGYSRTELLRMEVKDVEVGPPARKRTVKRFLRGLPMNRPKRFEGVHRRKDGSTFPVEVTLSLIEIGGRKVALVLARDITERRRVEEEMRLHSTFLTNMSEGANLIRFDDATIVYTNPKFDEMFGYAPGELLGKHASVLNAPGDEDPMRASKAIKTALKKRGIWKGEILNIRKDGTPFWCGVSVSMLEHSKFGRVGASVHRDITERKRAEDVIRESEEKFKDLAEHSPNMIFIEMEGEVVYANRKCEEVMGYSREEYYSPGFDFLKLVAPESQPAALRHLELHRAGDEVPPHEYTIVTKAGVRIDAIHTTKLIPYGGKRAILGIVTDVTERVAVEKEKERHLAEEKALRRAAEEASRAKDEFLALLSHELRTPMTAMMGWTWLLRSKDMSPREASEALDTIERNMNHQAQIIEDLLDVSRIVTGKMRLEPRAVEVAPVLSAALDVVLPAAKARSIELRAPKELPALKILGDPERLQQVFWNLFSNAVKFTPERGVVSVDLRQVGGDAVISVRDTGAGISPEYVEHVFDPFTQAEESLTRDHGGLGLGLAIVHQLVELHGGTVRARSEGLGCGSEFLVSFPVTQEQPRPASSERGGRPGTGVPLERLSGVHVLVVDDDPDTRSMLKATLEMCEARVSAAASAAGGIESFLRDRPDVVILDLAMPGEDGYDLLRRIRGLGSEGGGDVPAAALTALTRTEDRTKALRSGFQMYLPKPVEPAELAVVVRSLTRMRPRA